MWTTIVLVASCVVSSAFSQVSVEDNSVDSTEHLQYLTTRTKKSPAVIQSEFSAEPSTLITEDRDFRRVYGKNVNLFGSEIGRNKFSEDKSVSVDDEDKLFGESNTFTDKLPLYDAPVRVVRMPMHPVGYLSDQLQRQFSEERKHINSNNPIVLQTSPFTRTYGEGGFEIGGGAGIKVDEGGIKEFNEGGIKEDNEKGLSDVDEEEVKEKEDEKGDGKGEVHKEYYIIKGLHKDTPKPQIAHKPPAPPKASILTALKQLKEIFPNIIAAIAAFASQFKPPTPPPPVQHAPVHHAPKPIALDVIKFKPVIVHEVKPKPVVKPVVHPPKKQLVIGIIEAPKKGYGGHGATTSYQSSGYHSSSPSYHTNSYPQQYSQGQVHTSPGYSASYGGNAQHSYAYSSAYPTTSYSQGASFSSYPQAYSYSSYPVYSQGGIYSPWNSYRNETSAASPQYHSELSLNSDQKIDLPSESRTNINKGLEST